jgi:ribosomal protein S18 acetylase RimI-like enzyme
VLYTSRTCAIAASCRFYKKNGFTVKETVKDYYQKIEPADAFYLELATPADPATADSAESA